MKRFVTAFVTIAAVGVAFASPEAEFAAPLMGYVHDAAASQVRPITGTPGAATAGAGVAMPDIERMVLAGDGSFAIVSANGAETLSIVRFASLGPETRSIVDVPARFDKAVLSPGSTAALLYSKECHCMRVIESLRATPALLRTIALPEGSEVRALAIADNARVAAVSIKDGTALLYSEAQLRTVAISAGALTFDGTGDRLIAVDADGRTVNLVTNLGESPAVIDLLSERDGLSSPQAATFGSDTSILVADASAGVIVFNETDRTSRIIGCLCRPSTLEAIAKPGLYRLSGLDGGTVWLLDMSGDTPRTFFVPVRKEAGE